MKVCPNCKSRFDEGETFCPSDGSKLVDARELSPGELTDQVLDEVVELGDLVYADDLAERYEGRLVETDQWVRVTVFNQSRRPHEDRRGNAESVLELLGDGTPASLLAVHSFNVFRDDTPYVIEEEPDGRSLRTILDEDGALDWQTAVGVVAHLAQTLHWMAERGQIHDGVHPGAVYCADPEAGDIQVGDWLQQLFTCRREPLEAAEAGASFVGYPAYLSPEAIEGEEIDDRSLVYSIGMLFYELVLGEPPFTADETADVLKRHLHEQPVDLSIAAEETQLHPELDDVIGMMIAKDPEERFQTPRAIIAALSSLVGETPRDLAPDIEKTDDRVFPEGTGETDTGEHETVDGEREVQVPESDEAAEGGTEPGMGAVESRTEGSSETITGESVTVSEDDDAATDESSGVQTGESSVELEAVDREKPEDSGSESIIIQDPELAEEVAAEASGEATSPEEEALTDDDFWSDALISQLEAPDPEVVSLGLEAIGDETLPLSGDSAPEMRVRRFDATPAPPSEEADDEASTEAPASADDEEVDEESTKEGQSIADEASEWDDAADEIAADASEESEASDRDADDAEDESLEAESGVRVVEPANEPAPQDEEVVVLDESNEKESPDEDLDESSSPDESDTESEDEETDELGDEESLDAPEPTFESDVEEDDEESEEKAEDDDEYPDEPSYTDEHAAEADEEVDEAADEEDDETDETNEDEGEAGAEETEDADEESDEDDGEVAAEETDEETEAGEEATGEEEGEVESEETEQDEEPGDQETDEKGEPADESDEQTEDETEEEAEESEPADESDEQTEDETEEDEEPDAEESGEHDDEDVVVLDEDQMKEPGGETDEPEEADEAKESDESDDEAETGEDETEAPEEEEPDETEDLDESDEASDSSDEDIDEVAAEDAQEDEQEEAESEPEEVDESDEVPVDPELLPDDHEVDPDDTAEWFQTTDEEAWRASDVRNERDWSELLRQYATTGLIILLAVLFVGVILFSRFYSPSQTDEQDGASSEATETTDG